MNFVILDLEWNASYSKKAKSYINEIIEFGAVKCDENLNLISTFSSLVSLQIGEKISSVISELTNIKNEELDNALQYTQVVSKFKKWAGENILLTFGTSDVLSLIQNCKYFSGDRKIPFLTKYVNLQEYFQSFMKDEATPLLENQKQISLINAAKLLGIDTDSMNMHRACDDSLLAYEILKRIYNKKDIASFIQDAQAEEFYDKMTFKTNIIIDSRHHLVDKEQLKFTCEKCSGKAVKKSGWMVKNKRLFAEFRCRNCGYEFLGRVQIKEKYEGITISKKTSPLSKIEKPRKAMNDTISNMNLKIVKGVGLLTFNTWEGFEGIKHAFSTRIGGVSTGIYASMNLATDRSDNPKNVEENYRRMTNALGVSRDSLVCGAQTHTTNVCVMGAEHIGLLAKEKLELFDTDGIDAICTNQNDITLTIYAADCVPIYFYDPVKKAIALAHAGWRGTVSNIAGNTVAKLTEEYGCNPEDIKVAIGPSISFESFEVDKPCADEFLALDGSENFVRHIKEEKYKVDLWQCNKSFLIKSGIKDTNIVIGGVCSVNNSDLVFSHRVTKGRRGHNAAFLRLN